MSAFEAGWLTLLTAVGVLLFVESLVARWRDQQINKRIDKWEQP